MNEIDIDGENIRWKVSYVLRIEPPDPASNDSMLIGKARTQSTAPVIVQVRVITWSLPRLITYLLT